jgi:hypothetical protein
MPLGNVTVTKFAAAWAAMEALNRSATAPTESAQGRCGAIPTMSRERYSSFAEAIMSALSRLGQES